LKEKEKDKNNVNERKIKHQDIKHWQKTNIYINICENIREKKFELRQTCTQVYVKVLRIRTQKKFV